MKLWLIIPVKPFAEGKSRLASALSPVARAQLSQQLFTHVLRQALATPVLTGVIVVSRDVGVLDALTSPNLHFVHETGYDLNLALIQAQQVAIRNGADAILILPADLPSLTAADIEVLYQQGAANAGVIIVPSADNGTNALLLRPPDAIPFAFGRHSFAHHCHAAQRAGLPCVVHDAPNLAFDLDSPPDLARLSFAHSYEQPHEQPYTQQDGAMLHDL